MAWFKRKRPPTPEELLAEGRATSAAIAHSAGAAPIEPGSQATADFRMTVEDVFTITGRGTVATGRVASGTVAVGQTVRLLRDGTQLAILTVGDIEAFRKLLRVATAGDNVGLLLRGIDRSQLESGDVLSG